MPRLNIRSSQGSRDQRPKFSAMLKVLILSLVVPRSLVFLYHPTQRYLKKICCMLYDIVASKNILGSGELL